MKKLLALVLAMVMTFGLATVGTNAAFTDDATVKASDYSEAIQVLNGMKVFNGYPDGSFKPENDITRAEVAAMIYRLYTGDVKDNNTKIYTSDKFSDVKSTDWYAGYIGFCENSEFIYGYAGKFNPNDKVTGYQALAMVLRAMGYNKQNDFTGADWKTWTANFAQQRGLVTNVSSTTLDKPATRALVAEILFEAAQEATVEYTTAFGYQTANPLNGALPSLGWKNFGLWCFPGNDDDWGRPQYTWGDRRATTKYHTYDEDAYATIAYEATKTYTTPVAECDVAHDLGLTDATVFNAYVNAEAVEMYNVRPKATNVYIGGQGRLTEVYNIPKTATPDGVAIKRIVMIDTFLAKVTKVEAPVFDRNNHLTTDAMLYLDVYTGGRAGIAAAAQTVTALRASNGKTPWSYAVGDYVLINAQTNGTASVYVVPFAANEVNANRNGSATGFATKAADATQFKMIEVLGVAETVTGAQTVLSYNTSKHTIDGVEYDDALEFHKDDAGRKITTYTWFLDQYGNLIGSAEIATQYTYGVINSIWWVPDNTTGGGYASATVTYMDGTTATIKLGTIRFTGAKSGANGTVDVPLRRAVVGVSNEMFANTPNVAATAYLPVSTYAWANAQADERADRDGILNNELFRFNTTSTGVVVAAEVDGVSFANSGATNIAFNKAVANNGGVITNDNTVFLVKTGASSFKSYTGRSNLPANYAEAEIDWVNTNSDPFAEYVFIKGTNATAVSATRFYLTTPVYTWNLNAAGTAIENYYLTGYVNGVLGTLTVPATLADASNGSAVVDTIVNAYTNAPGSSFVVATNGTTVVAALPAANQLTADGDTYTIDADTSMIYIVGAAGDAKLGNVFVDASTNVYYTGADTTPLVGNWADDMSTKNVVLVYKTTNGVHHITEAYVYDKVTGIAVGSGDVTPTAKTDTINWTIHYTMGGAVQTDISVSTSCTVYGTTAWTASASVEATKAMAKAGFASGTYTIYAATIDGDATATVTGSATHTGVIRAVVG